MENSKERVDQNTVGKIVEHLMGLKMNGDFEFIGDPFFVYAIISILRTLDVPVQLIDKVANTYLDRYDQSVPKMGNANFEYAYQIALDCGASNVVLERLLRASIERRLLRHAKNILQRIGREFTDWEILRMVETCCGDLSSDDFDTEAEIKKLLERLNPSQKIRVERQFSKRRIIIQNYID